MKRHFAEHRTILFNGVRLSVVVLLLLSAAIALIAAAPKSSSYKVTSYIYDTLNAVTPVCAIPPCPTLLHSDSLSSGSNAYSSIKSGSITSQVTGIEWDLNLTKQAARTVYLTFSQPVAGSQSQP